MRNETKFALIALTVIALQLAGAYALADADARPEPSRTLQMLTHFQRAQVDLDEDNIDRADRLATIAHAIDRATDVRWQRSLLVSVAWHESRLASHVQDCRIKGDKGKAVGLFQSWVFKEWDRCPTLDEQTQEAVRHLKSAWRYCHAKTTEQKVLRGVSLYSTGRACFHPIADPRLSLWRFLEERF